MRQFANENPSIVSIGTGSPFWLPTSDRPPKFWTLAGSSSGTETCPGARPVAALRA
jgi:hypothetical protein